ncbi:MAG TPA: HupE/UreJ family protein [Vicinamibacterales bacterium]|nr:HupE/UreJ family protein [Vicinamibacterales bacterium]
MLVRGVLTAVALLLAAPSPTAHEIPNEVTIHTFLKPEGQHLTLLVRAPAKALRDIEVPRKEGVYQGYIDLGRADRAFRDAATMWIADFVKLYEENRQLPYPEVSAVRASLPSDRAFESYDQALASITGPPLPPETNLVWEESLLDVAFTFPIESDQSRFAISPGLTRLGERVNVVLRFLPPGGAERAFDVHGDPGIVQLDPRWHQAALRFTRDGFDHILDGIDHLLFLLALVIPFRRLRSLVVVVTAFTLAHSVTLVASAYGIVPDGLWFPPLVETLIAVSIVYMTFENIVAAARQKEGGAAATLSVGALNRRWAVAFGFGLIHGFGFSFALGESLQFAGSHLLTSLLAFNVGVELGQLLVLVILVPVLNLLFRYVVAEKVGTILLSALVAHTGWHWATERGSALLEFPWPTLDTALLLTTVRMLIVMVAASAAAWLIFGVLLKSFRGVPQNLREKPSEPS